jgi:hypothetical protein
MDLTLPVTGGGVAAVVTGWLAKKGIAVLVMKANRWDKHLEQCQNKAVDFGRLEERLLALSEKVDLRFDSMHERVENLSKQITRLDTRTHP